MKRLFLAALAALLLAAGLAAAIAYDAGYVLIAYGGYTIETTAWVGLTLLLLLLVVMYAVVALLHRGLRQGGVIARWRARHRARRGQQQTASGLLAFMEGDYRRAVKQLESAARRSDTPLINHLMAARASAALGDTTHTEELLLRAEQSGRQAALAVALSQAELQLGNGQYAEAVRTLDGIRNQAHRHPHVLRLLQRAYLSLGDWERLLALLPELRRYLKLPEAELADLARSAHLHQLDAAGATGPAALEACWAKLPKAHRRDGALVARHAYWLLQHGKEAEAELLLREQLRREWQPELVAIYGRVRGSDPQKQLALAESWLNEHGEEPILLRSLGRIALANQLWGKARDYFEASLRHQESPETCAELGRLLLHLDQPERAAHYFERGLTAATPALPSLPLPVLSRVG
jgi:HemY protein